MNLSQTDIIRVTDRMSVGDIFHKHNFIHMYGINTHIYAILSSIFSELQCDVFNEKFYKCPRFGLLWTKQSALFAKKKYVQTCKQSLNKLHWSDTMIYRQSILFKNEMECYQDNPEALYNLYNSNNLQEIVQNMKQLPKKKFISVFK